MKKLMIAAAIVCAAAMSQAATASWTITNVKDPATLSGDVANLAKGSVYMFFCDSQTSADSLIAKLTSDFKGNVGSASYSYDKPASAAAGTFSVTKTTVGADNLPVVTTDLGLKEDTAYYAFAAIVNDTISGLSDDDKFYITNVKSYTTATGSDGSNSLGLGAQAERSSVAGNWTTVAAVPEPTSAMLLLLGVAGLALRRRRA